MIKAKATGFFYTKEANGRWWLITPEGNRFIATGFNHADMRMLKASYNKEFWEEKIKTPEDFYDSIVEDVEYLNMTAKGYGHSVEKNRIPYVEQLNFPAPMTWADICEFPDVFSKEYEDKCNEIAQKVCTARKDDPMLIGYYLCDCVEWPIFGKSSKRLAENWLDSIKRRGPQSTGKNVFVDLVRENYGTIDSFNSIYGTSFRSFDELKRDREFVYTIPANKELVYRDDQVFLSLLARKFYSTTCNAVRRIDKNHLILGEVFDANRKIPEQVLYAAAAYVNVISLQYYGHFKDQAATLEGLHSKIARPILLSDSCYSIATANMPRPCGPKVLSQEERAEAFKRYAYQALSTPYVIGWFWCGYIDSSLELESRRQHSGLKDAWGNYHEPLCTYMRDTYANLYDITRSRLGRKKYPCK